jgi:glycosyltransferase involved in cell wall biosynthesis
LVTPGFPKNEEDTTCIPALQVLVKSLKKSDVKLTLISLHYPYHSNEYRWNGLKVIPLNGKNSRFKKRFLLKAKLKRYLSEIHAAEPISIIHSFWLQEASVWSLSWAKKSGVPVIASAMGQEVLVENTFLNKLKACPPDQIICLSQFHQKQLFSSSGLKSEVIGFGVEDLSAYKQEKTIDLIGVGNLIPIKNYPYFIDICFALKQNVPAFKAVIIGVGSQLNMLQQLIETNELTENILLLGELPYEETLNHMARAKVLLHPSRFEGYGMIFGEALALQTHIASFPVGIAEELQLENYLTGEPQADALLIEELLNKQVPDSVVDAIDHKMQLLLDVYANPRKR